MTARQDGHLIPGRHRSGQAHSCRSGPASVWARLVRPMSASSYIMAHWTAGAISGPVRPYQCNTRCPTASQVHIGSGRRSPATAVEDKGWQSGYCRTIQTYAVDMNQGLSCGSSPNKPDPSAGHNRHQDRVYAGSVCPAGPYLSVQHPD